MSKIKRDYITPKWLKIKKLYEENTNRSSKYGTNFEPGGELDQLTDEFIDMLGLFTRRFGFECTLEDVHMNLWKERIWCLTENAGLLQPIAWKQEKEQEEKDAETARLEELELEQYEEDDREPTDAELFESDKYFH